VFPEALQLKLECEDERVVDVEPAIGYIHRGIEKAAELNPFRNNVFLCERICGICSFMHALCYCQGIEKLMNVEIPRRAKFLRTFWAELSRLHNHLMWMGFLADAMGFESLFMQCWRIREIILDLTEMTTGQRVIYGTCAIGGVKRDIDKEMVRVIEEKLATAKEMVDSTIKPTVLNDPTLKRRTVGKGILTREQAELLGAVGPVARASGVPLDTRQTGYAAFDELGFEPIVETAGDVYARTLVRLREWYQSREICLKALSLMPEGEISTRAAGRPEGEVISRVEQHRGEVFYYIKGNGTANLERLRVRTPTFANIPALLVMLRGYELADVPVITLSIDPCIACTER
jgi:ech hydrogenase subunit E